MAVVTNREICFNPRTKQYSPVLVSETVLCANITLGNDTEKGLQLTEQPSFDRGNYPIQVKRDSDSLVFTETISDTIGGTEFLADYSTGSGNIILASTTTLGESFTVTYYSIGSLNTVYNILNSGTLSQLGSLDAGSRKIITLADATIASDNKDSATGGQLYTEQQDRISADSTLQGNINTLSGTVTNLGTDKLSLSGGTMSGAINMGSQQILGLLNATTEQEPAVYAQVQQVISELPNDNSYRKIKFRTHTISGLSGTLALNLSGKTLLNAMIEELNGTYSRQWSMFFAGSYYFYYDYVNSLFSWNFGNNCVSIRYSYLVAY